MGDTEVEKKEIVPEPSDEKKVSTYPLVRYADIPEDTKLEIIEIITGAVERYITDLEMACKTVQEEMDRTYGPQWHCVVGECFGFDVTHQVQHLIYMFFMGNLGVLVFKCG